MITAKCIHKFRDTQGRIIGYRLQDLQEKTIDIKPEELKNAIGSKQIEITNLTLTKDGRLIDKKEVINNKYQKRFPTDEELNNIVLKSRMLGLKVEDLGFNCYAIFKSKDEVLILLSSSLTSIRNEDEDTHFSEEYSLILENYDTIRVIGGSNLIDATYMFSGCIAQTIDLSRFDSSKVKYMDYMFYKCGAETINLLNFNTSSVTSMSCMFYGCYTQVLNLSSFITSNVIDMSYMFGHCMAHVIDISSFDTSKVKDTQGIFDTSKVKDMRGMFDECKVKKLNVSVFSTESVESMRGMFRKCKVKALDLSNFNTSNTCDMTEMFKGCNAQITATDPKILREVSKR